MNTAEALKGNIKKALEERGMSALALSQATHIPYSTVQRKLSDRPQNITMEELGSISAALHLSPVDLIIGQTTPHPTAVAA